MSGLWTPGGGEPREPARPDPDRRAIPAAAPEPAPTAEEMAAVRELHDRLAATPVADVIVNHAIGIWQLALVHLGRGHPARRAGPAPGARSRRRPGSRSTRSPRSSTA